MERLRVCLLTTSYPRFEGDVSGAFMHRLAKELTRVVDVTVLAPGDARARPSERIGDLVVHRFSYLRPRRLQRVAYGLGIPENLRRRPGLLLQLPFFMVGFVLAAFREARSTDVFHANWSPSALAALPAARVFGRPIVLTLRGSDVRSLPRWLSRFIFKRVEVITAFSSEAERAAMLGFETISVQTPIDTSLFHPDVQGDRAAQSIGLDPSRTIVSFIARLYHFKDPMTLVEAMPLVLRENPSVQFAIVGDGVLRDDIRRRVAELGLRSAVAVPGARADVNEILAASTVFVALSPIENIWSATITEAATIGIPCILTDAGHTSTVFTHGEDCLLVRPQDPEGLARAILRLVGDEELRAALVARCRELHRRHGHDPDVIVQRFDELYRRAIADVQCRSGTRRRRRAAN